MAIFNKHNKKTILIFLLLTILVLLLLVGIFNPSRHNRASCKNTPVILISLDTLRADKLNYYGFSKYQTSPILDQFGEDSITFMNCFVQEPWTLTSHMSIFTGLYPKSHGVGQDTPLKDGYPTLASILKKRGYKTVGFVDGGYLDKQWGFDRGFDQYISYDNRHFKSSLPDILKWIKKEAPHDCFFLFIHTYDVHSDGKAPIYKSPSPFQGMFSKDINAEIQRFKTAKQFKEERGYQQAIGKDFEYIHATYSEGVRHVDFELKKIFDALKQKRLFDKSIIIITSDHGEGLYDHGRWAHSDLYDHTIRVPLFIKLPHGKLANTKRDSLAQSIDLTPTILDLLGFREDAKGMEGKSLVPVILDNREINSYIFSQLVKKHFHQYTVRTSSHKLIINIGKSRKKRKKRNILFYNIKEDPGEEFDISYKKSEKYKELINLLNTKIAGWKSGRKKKKTKKIKADPRINKQLRALGYLQ